MPILMRAAHVGDVPPGTSLVTKIRGRRLRILNLGGTFYAFDADKAPMGREVTEADLLWARQQHAPELRAVVRGTFVHVAQDAVREAAPASVQSIELPAQSVP